MSDSLEGKIKLVFFLSIIGVTLSVLGMGTEFWAELAQPKRFSGNQTCQMAHYGLWKGCIRTLWVADVDPERTSCGPAELPGGETRTCLSDSILLRVFCVAGEVSGGHASLLFLPQLSAHVGLSGRPRHRLHATAVRKGAQKKGLIGIYVRPQQDARS